MKFGKENRQKPLIQFQLFIFYETRLFTEKFSRTTTIHPGIFGGWAPWADGGPPRMNTIAPRDQFKPMRIGENLVVNYNSPYYMASSRSCVDPVCGGTFLEERCSHAQFFPENS